MAVDMFLVFGDAKSSTPAGESKDKDYAKCIDVLAWSWGVSNSGNAHIGGGAGAGKANVQDISLTKWVDAASSELIKACTIGTHFAKAKLVVRKAGGTPLEFITIVMEEVFISSVLTGGSGGEDRLTENVVLNFAKFEYKYTSQTEKGAKDKDYEFGFDIAANTKTK